MRARTISLRAWMAKLLIDGEVAALTSGDEKDLFDFACGEGVTALADIALARTGPGIPEQVRATFRNAARGMVAHELARQQELRNFICMLAPDTSVLILKGTALAYWLYPSPACRPRADCDILVENKLQVKKVVAVLVESGFLVVGSLLERAAGFEITLERVTAGGLVHRIDLHWRLLNNAALTKMFSFDELWRSSISIPALAPQARGLGRVHALAHALLHRLTNMAYDQQDRLIWLYDIHLLSIGCTNEDWQEFKQMCGVKAIAKPCLDGLRASRLMLGTGIPAQLESELAEMAATESWPLDVMSAIGGMDRVHLAALPWHEKPGWLRRKLFPSRNFMRRRYGAEGAANLTKAYLLRWWVAVRRAVGRP